MHWMAGGTTLSAITKLTAPFTRIEYTIPVKRGCVIVPREVIATFWYIACAYKITRLFETPLYL